MKPDKEHIRHCLLFCFHQKKNATDAHRIICMMKMLQPLERVQIGLNDLKMVISISVTKNTPDITSVEEDETFPFSFNQFRDITSILQPCNTVSLCRATDTVFSVSKATYGIFIMRLRRNQPSLSSLQSRSTSSVEDYSLIPRTKMQEVFLRLIIRG